MSYSEKKLDIEIYKSEKSSHIKGYKIPDKVCDDMIEWFHVRKDLSHPVDRNNFEKNYRIKKSTDISVHKEWISEYRELQNYQEHLDFCIDDYVNTYSIPLSEMPLSIISPYNIQWYKPNEGFPKLHCERAPNDESLFRVLVWMTYLNDVEDGGTFFPSQNIKLEAKKGDTWIWPADFTHPHKGQIVNKHKYIATGWVEYAEILPFIENKADTFEETIYEEL